MPTLTKIKDSLFITLFVEFGPLVLFFVMFELFNFMTSTLILVVSVVIALTLSITVQKRFALFPIVSSGSIIVFGLATLILKNPNYIIFKDTLFYTIFGTFILWNLYKGELLLKKLFINVFAITDKGWKEVSLRWGVFMILLAISNQTAQILLTADQWVNYKLIALGCIFIFSTYQFTLSSRERLPEANGWGFRVSNKALS